MNKIELKKKQITVSKGEKKILHIFDYENQDNTYNLEENAKLVVYQYGINISNNIVINLDGENSSVEYHYSNINKENNRYNILVNHNASNTVSNIYNHGLNVFNNNLDYNVTGKVLATSNNCICNQENQIINLENGHSTVLPNLLIDNYNVISNHSAYIGKFKDEILFYLMSRGISKKSGYELLIKTFLINSSESEEDKILLEEEISKI